MCVQKREKDIMSKDKNEQHNWVIHNYTDIGTSRQHQHSCQSTFKRLIGMMIVNRYFHYSFLFSFLSAQPFLIEGVLGSKNLSS